VKLAAEKDPVRETRSGERPRPWRA